MADGGLAGRTLLLMALEDPAGDLKNALLCHCLGFYHQLLCCLLCLTPQEKEKRNRHGKKWQDTLCSPSGQLVLRELLRRRTYCCCGMPLLLDCCWNICTYCFVSVYIWSQNVLRLDDYPCHWARCRPSGLFGQVITVLDSTSCHVPTLKRFKVLTWRLNSKFLTLHMQWTVMILIWKPSNPIEYLERIR